MLIRRITVSVVAVGITLCTVHSTQAQNFPLRPVRIVTSGVGGGPDAVVRIMAPPMSESMGQQVFIDNRSSGVIPGQIVSQSPPDGYTLLHYANTLWIGPLLQPAPYDTFRDFVPVTLASKSPNILVAHPSLPVKSVKDVIALAKSHPGELTFSAGGIGGASHLSGELFKAMTGVRIVIVPYKSGSQETADLLGGHVQMTFGSAGQVAPQIKAGKLRGMAVTSAQPSSLFPEYPTMTASGLPGFEYTNITGTFAPGKTPMPIVNRLSQEAAKALARPDTRERLAATGIEGVGSTSEEFLAAMKSEAARLGKLIKDANIRAE
jgi:tripartite-type tricarboxylate transporter receptor subunit TctC